MKASDTSISGKAFIIIQACTRDCLQSLATFLIIICVYIRRRITKEQLKQHKASKPKQFHGEKLYQSERRYYYDRNVIDKQLGLLELCYFSWKRKRITLSVLIKHYCERVHFTFSITHFLTTQKPAYRETDLLYRNWTTIKGWT
jgi:hypothetical protein